MLNIINKIKDGSIKTARQVFNAFINKMTHEYQKQYGFDIGEGEHATWNNEADAFKHAYMQWVLAFYGNEDFAKNLGDMHEDETPYAPQGERNMDLWNNAIGREIAYNMKNSNYGDNREDLFESSSAVAARLIMQKMREGKLITSPDDTRQFEKMEYELLKDSDRVFYQGEFTDKEEKIADEIFNQYLEQAIDNGWKMPEKGNLENRVLKGELVYVQDYTRSNGTKVSSYYRKRRIH